MSTTLATLQTMCRRDLRDPKTVGGVAVSYAFSDDEISDLIGEGIDAVNGCYRKQEVIDSTSITASVYEYSVSSAPIRVDVYNADGTIAYDGLPKSPGDGQNAGWVFFAGKLYIPMWAWTTGQKLRIWGLTEWTRIDSSSASSATTDLDAKALSAVRDYVRYAAFRTLASNRAKIEQLQQNPEVGDASPIAINALWARMERHWHATRDRIRQTW